MQSGLGQELSEEEEVAHANLAREAKAAKLADWDSLEVFKPLRAGAVRKAAVDTRWALAWKMVEGVKTARARRLAEGFQDPDLRDGVAYTSGCVSLRSSHLEITLHSEIAGVGGGWAC